MSYIIRFSLAVLFSFCIIAPSWSQDKAAEEPTFRLYLIGDAGEKDTTGAVLRELQVMLERNPNSAVVFLGDNCYMKSWLLPIQLGGFNNSNKAKGRMMAQLDILEKYKGYAYFVPGNHDWWNCVNIKKGKRKLLKEQLFVEETVKNYKDLKNKDEGAFLPLFGHPGPVSRIFNNGKTRVIFVDTYRLIIEEARSKKKYDTLLMNKFYRDLEAQLNDATAKKEKIIVVAHHPIHSKGRHSFPLRFAEKVIMRFGDANTNYPSYKAMAIKLDSLLKAQRRPDIFYVAGHEHSLEYFYNDSLHYIVSGAGSKVDNVNLESCILEGECLQWNQEGFFEIEFYGRRESVILYHRKDETTPLQETCVSGCK